MTNSKFQVGDTVRVVRKVDSAYWIEDMDASIGKKMKVINVMVGGAPVLSDKLIYPAASLEKISKKRSV